MVDQSSQTKKKAERMLDVFLGRSKANNFEPYILSLLYTLNQMWDTKKYEKEIAPIVDSLDEIEGYNQIKGKIYAY